jgi:hypothetical protein
MLLVAAYLLAGLVGLVAVMAVVGSMLPRDHVAARRAAFAKPAEDVWREMVALAQQSDVPVEVEVEEPPRRRITRIVDDGLPFGGRWILELEPDGAMTWLKITEDGFVRNPVFRLISALAPNATKTKFLRQLGGKLGVPVNVEPAEPTRR